MWHAPVVQIYGIMDNENVHGLDQALRRLDEVIDYCRDDVPVVIGTEAVNYFKSNFENEAWEGEKWAPRSTKRPGGTNGQKVLSKSGELAESIDYRHEGGTVVIYSDKPYAQIHNEGGTIQLTEQQRKYFWAQHYLYAEAGNDDLAEQYKWLALAKEIKMPQRQYMGESEALILNISDKIVRDLTRILNGI